MPFTLEIHHIDVKGGDATAIVVKDQSNDQILSKVLIDAGAEGSGAYRLGAYLTQQKIDTNNFDYIIGSHYHNDHIDGFRKANITAKNFIDIGGYTINQAPFTPENGTGISKQTNYFEAYKHHLAQNGGTRTKIPFLEKGFQGTAAPLEIELVAQSGIKLICYGGNGIIANGTNVLAAQKPNKNRDFDPNDHSLIFILEWEDFRYFTAGDLSGDVNLQSYYNIEEMLVDYLLAGPLNNKTINVIKVNHHGSEFSNYPPATNKNSFLERLKPETLIVPVNQNKGVPSISFLTQALAYCKNQAATMSFVNDFFYAQSNVRYNIITDIANETAVQSNIEFSDNIATLGETLSVVICRHSGGIINTNTATSNQDQVINKNSYQVIVKKGTLPNIRRTVPNFSSYSIASINANLEPSIRSGFMTQATKIKNWLDQDALFFTTEGIDYLNYLFPTLVDIICANDDVTQLTNELEAKMNDLFDRNFAIQTLLILPKLPNDLTFEEKETLYWLLIRNVNQFDYNFRRNATGRFEQEPYQLLPPQRQTAQIKFNKKIKLEE